MYSTSVCILQIQSMQSARVSEEYREETNCTLKGSFLKSYYKKCNMQSFFIIFSLAGSLRIKWKCNHYIVQ